MSASTERKNRQAAREAGTDKKTLAKEKELKELVGHTPLEVAGGLCVGAIVTLVMA